MKNAIQKVTVVGTGNVSYHLCGLFYKAGIELAGVFGRNQNEVRAIGDQFNCPVIDRLDAIAKDSTVLLCIPDDAINETTQKIDAEIRLAYTSGSVPISDLPNRHHLGVFYPLQTFSRSSTQPEPFPILIEATNQQFADELAALASRISENVIYADSEQRKKIHLTAVWVNNFTNHIVYQAQQLSDEYGLDFDLFIPLLRETVKKLEHTGAFDAQTGPARRGDMKVISEQSSGLSGRNKELYDLITLSILETYGKSKL